MRAEGFTYVEILLAVALTSVLVAAASQATAFAVRRAARMSADAWSETGTATSVLARDLRSAVLHDAEARTTFVLRSDGAFDRLEFYRTDGSATAPSPKAIAYAIRRGADGRGEVWRSEGGVARRLCGDVTTFDVSAFDGETWKREWGWDAERATPLSGIRGLPLLVSVRLSAGGRDVTTVCPLLTPLLARALHE